MTQTQIWDDERMPAGSYRYPDTGPRSVRSIGADVSYTYPVGYLWDAVGRLAQVRAILDGEPPAVMWWLSDVYHRASIDPASAGRQMSLWSAAARQPRRLAHTVGRVGLLRDLAEAEFGPPRRTMSSTRGRTSTTRSISRPTARSAFRFHSCPPTGRCRIAG